MAVYAPFPRGWNGVAEEPPRQKAHSTACGKLRLNPKGYVSSDWVCPGCPCLEVELTEWEANSTPGKPE